MTTWFIPPDDEKVHRWLTEAELQAMLADAYKRGAEAMRQAAADHIKANIIGDQTGMILVGRIYEKDVRGLQLPEYTK